MSKSSEMIQCPVCGVETNRKKRCGAFVCDACKRFFLRTRSRADSLKCDRHNNNCYEETKALSTQKLNWFGSVLRQICSKCRYDRCIAQGMHQQSMAAVEKQPNKNMAVSVYSSQPVPPIAVPDEIIERYQFEDVLKAVVDSSFDIAKTIRTPVTLNAICLVYDELSFWQHVGLPLFEFNVSRMGAYVKSLPGYNSIRMEDRIILFINAYTRYVFALGSTIPGPIAAYADMLMQCCSSVCGYLSDYDLPYVLQLRKIVAEWQPSHAEWAIFMSLLFFNDHDARILDPTPIRVNIVKLKQLHRALMVNKFGNDMQRVEAHQHKLEEILCLIEEASIGRIYPLREAVQRNWQVFANSKMLAEFFGVGKHRLEIKDQRRQLNIQAPMPWD